MSGNFDLMFDIETIHKVGHHGALHELADNNGFDGNRSVLENIGKFLLL